MEIRVSGEQDTGIRGPGYQDFGGFLTWIPKAQVNTDTQGINLHGFILGKGEARARGEGRGEGRLPKLTLTAIGGKRGTRNESRRDFR